MGTLTEKVSTTIEPPPTSCPIRTHVSLVTVLAELRVY